MSPSTFGALLRTHRVRNGLTLRALGDALGVSHAAISAVERGARPTLAGRHWPALSEALDIPDTDLLAAALASRPLRVDMSQWEPEVRPTVCRILEALPHLSTDEIRHLAHLAESWSTT